MELIKHIFIEFYFRKEKRFLLEHSYQGNKSILLENYGVYDGCLKVADILIDKIKEKQKYISINNQWIDEIKLYYVSDPLQQGGYDTNSVIENNKFKPLIIFINPHNDDIYTSLVHELQHAYEDYNRRINNKPSLTDYSDKLAYAKYATYIQDENNTKRTISRILYFLTSFEKNAYISEISAEMKRCDKSFPNIESVVEYIKTTTAYRAFEKIERLTNMIVNIQDKDKQEKIVTFINEMTNSEFNTYKQFVKFLSNKLLKCSQKINTLLPKIAYETLKTGKQLYHFQSKEFLKSNS
jgi:hypothetical protein